MNCFITSLILFAKLTHRQNCSSISSIDEKAVVTNVVLLDELSKFVGFLSVVKRV
jgi:hypothetical protein